ncbi:MAG: DUF3887 domain-containing protein [Anaerovoracaceae bacterium]
MKKRYIVVPAALALLYAICAGSGELPGGFEKNHVFRSAKDFINKLNEGDFEACCQRFNEAMAASMDKEKLENKFRPITEILGPFVRFKGISISVKKSSDAQYAVCIVKCQYEKEDATFTLFLDKEMKIGGLYIK